MNNIIHGDFSRGDGLTYILDNGDDDKKSVVGCSLYKGEISVVKNINGFSVFSKNTILSRGAIAKFLWMAAYMLDSDQEFLPDELVCLDR